MAAVLEVRDAQKRFGDTQALAGAGFELHPGEWVGLLGPNGAGKTTLVRAICGRVRLDHGSIRVHGRVLDAVPRRAAPGNSLGVVPQDIALYPALTARENLQTFGALAGVGAGVLDARIERALEWTGLAARADEPVKQFSGGMKRRLNLACSVLHEPDIVLLDEPTAGVDPQSRERIWEMLRELHSRGASLLLTTHQLDEAQQVCERILIIDHGRLIAAGTFTELVRQTIGHQRRMVCRLEDPAPASLRQAGFEISGESTVTRMLGDAAAELPGVLAQIAAAGARVRELSIEAPSLQAVFIHLTGRELRE